MRQLFVAGLSTSSGLVDSLTWLLQIKQAGTRDAYDSTLKAPLNPPTAAIIPPPPPSPLFPPVSQASQGSSDRRKSASGLFQVSQIREGGDFHFPFSVSFIPWALISFSLCTVTWFLLKNEKTRFFFLVFCMQKMWSQFICLFITTFLSADISQWTGWSILCCGREYILHYCLINILRKLWVDLIQRIQLVHRCWMLCPKTLNQVLWIFEHMSICICILVRLSSKQSVTVVLGQHVSAVLSETAQQIHS